MRSQRQNRDTFGTEVEWTAEDWNEFLSAARVKALRKLRELSMCKNKCIADRAKKALERIADPLKEGKS